MTDEKTKDIIRETVYETMKIQNVDYYKSMESLLRNYKKLEKRVNEVDEYLDVFVQGHSKSIVTMSGRGTSANRGFISDDEKLEEMENERADKYRETCIGFGELDQVVKMFSSDPDFRVIELYYLSTEQKTMMDVALELGITEKTARKHRTRLVRDMAICLFGVPASVSNYRNRTESVP